MCLLFQDYLSFIRITLALSNPLVGAVFQHKIQPRDILRSDESARGPSVMKMCKKKLIDNLSQVHSTIHTAFWKIVPQFEAPEPFESQIFLLAAICGGKGAEN